MQWTIGLAFIIAWSSGFVGATLADEAGADTWALLTWRYILTFVILLVAGLATRHIRHSFTSLSKWEIVQQLILAVLSHVFFLGGVFASANRGLDAGLSALVCALQPLLVTAASHFFFSEHIKFRQWTGLLLALGGVALSVGSIDATGISNVGWVILSLGGLSTASLLERTWKPQMPVRTSLTLQVGFATVIFGCLALCSDGIQLQFSGKLSAALGWLVILSGLTGYASFIWCLRHLGARTTSTLLYLTAPVTMLWAWGMFGQQPTSIQWIGLAVVLSGVAIATWRIKDSAS